MIETTPQHLSTGGHSNDEADMHPVALPLVDTTQSIGVASFLGDDVTLNPLHDIRTTLSVSVGSVQITVGELMAAREHQILRLEQLVDQPVDVLLEGKVVARGHLVTVDGHFGVRICQLPVALRV